MHFVVNPAVCVPILAFTLASSFAAWLESDASGGEQKSATQRKQALQALDDAGAIIEVTGTNTLREITFLGVDADNPDAIDALVTVHSPMLVFR